VLQSARHTASKPEKVDITAVNVPALVIPLSTCPKINAMISERV